MGLTRIRAEQISDIDYKQAVRVITVSNVTLSGGAPSTVDSVNLVAGDRILVSGQDTGSQNGLYTVSTLGTGANGTWIRTSDGNTDGEIEAGMIVMVTEGTVYKDTQWKLTTNNPIVIGTTALTFEQNSAFAFGNIYANTTAVLANTVGDSITFVAGTNVTIIGNNTAKTVTFSATGGGGSSDAISNGTSNVYVVSSGGDVTVGIAGTSNIAIFSSTGLDVTGEISATGNITGGNLSGTNITGTLTTAAQPNVTSVGTLTSLNSGAISSSGNITGANILTGGLISATGNITSAATIKGANIDSTNADLAEHYRADRLYVPGTVMIFGGQDEITQSTQYADPRVAGVISTAPAHTMNSSAAGQPLALQGRVPCRVVGTISKGDLMTTSDWPGVATRLKTSDWVPGCVIGKSLAAYDSAEPGVIEVAVGRL